MKLNLRGSPVIMMVFLLLISAAVKAQSAAALTGSWQSQEGDTKTVLLFQDNYFTQSVFKAKEFVMTFGGPYTVENNAIKINVEFNSANGEEVGKQLTSNFSINGNNLQLALNNKAASLQRTGDGSAPLDGVWQITGRMQEGKVEPINHTGTRKTLKMLTGGRFQWFAIDPATKMFSGTGGGTYSFVNGKYTENIELFSRDNNRVGASLSFDGKLENGDWHHSGLSSAGASIYEVWGRVE
ncbi:membrane or secreted protein [Albibacterium bauzanense]|uniref:Membrane or secreted protein n=1 Tax=Albibacterium bauzanense TaxID=653929 RepID=A0A4R1M1G1_9SPHI|nr:membrane or secreted protein [Albibacterium bauzanense]TCK85798.1 hypothetical protein C8N28_1114 [Albibacterium bauzanense]